MVATLADAKVRINMDCKSGILVIREGLISASELVLPLEIGKDPLTRLDFRSFVDPPTEV